MFHTRAVLALALPLAGLLMWPAGAHAQSRGGRSSTPAPRNVHGNSARSTRPQHLYAITRTDRQQGRTSIYKFGVSGGRTRQGQARPYSERAGTQVRRLNRDPQATQGGRYSYGQRVIGRAGDRATILNQERNAVRRHQQQRGGRPPGNIRP